MQNSVLISSTFLLLTEAAAAVSDAKLAEHVVLAPFAVFTNFGSNLNGNGSDDDAEGFSNS